MSTFVTAQIYILWICYFLTHVFPELKVLQIHTSLQIHIKLKFRFVQNIFYKFYF
jgi:hypothetical protein